MCKPQRLARVYFALSLLTASALAPSCSTRHRGASTGDITGVGDRGGSWPGGIGAVLRFNAREGRLVIHSAPADGAAARAGLRSGDVIESIDGAPIAGRSEREVVAALRGEVGTVVVLRVSGGDAGASREVRVERAPYRRARDD